jgi:Tripartite tricarboxylate transporter TctB family
MTDQRATAPDRPGRGISLDVAAGIFLIVLAGLGYVGSLNLDFGQMRGIGPGLMPKVSAALVGAFGILIVVQGLISKGDRMEPWSWRGIVFVLGAVLVFAATVRSLGLAFAGPLAVIISSLADRDTRAIEVVLFAIGLTALCVGMFKYALRLPIPLAPLILGY